MIPALTSAAEVDGRTFPAATAIAVIATTRGSSVEEEGERESVAGVEHAAVENERRHAADDEEERHEQRELQHPRSAADQPTKATVNRL